MFCFAAVITVMTPLFKTLVQTPGHLSSAHLHYQPYMPKTAVIYPMHTCRVQGCPEPWDARDGTLLKQTVTCTCKPAYSSQATPLRSRIWLSRSLLFAPRSLSFYSHPVLTNYMNTPHIRIRFSIPSLTPTHNNIIPEWG